MDKEFIKIDTVICDYGGVIADHYCEPFQSELAAALGTTSAGARELTSERSPHGRLYRLGCMTQTEFWAAVRSASPNKNFDDDHVQELWAKTYILNQAVLSLLHHLKEQGVFTAMVTNEDRARYKFLRQQHNLDYCLCLTVASFEVGHMKPEPAIYNAVLKMCGRSDYPDRVLYIDDRETHAIAARKIGLNAYTYTNAGDLSAYLASSAVCILRR